MLFFDSLGLAIMFSSSSCEVPSGTPLARKPFSQLREFSQQLRRSVPPLGLTVQVDPNNATASLSHTYSWGGRVTRKFNLGVGTGGGVSGSVGPQVGEAARSLIKRGSEYPLEL